MIRKWNFIWVSLKFLQAELATLILWITYTLNLAWKYFKLFNETNEASTMVQSNNQHIFYCWKMYKVQAWGELRQLFCLFASERRMTCIHTAFWKDKNSILSMYNAWKKFKIISYFQINVEPREALSVMILKHKNMFSVYQLDINIWIYTLSTYLQPIDSINKAAGISPKQLWSRAVNINIC